MDFNPSGFLFYRVLMQKFLANLILGFYLSQMKPMMWFCRRSYIALKATPHRGVFMKKKSELVAIIAERAELTKKKAHEVLDIVVETVIDSLKEGDSVALAGLGTLSVGDRAARNGHNPRTGEAIKIAASKCIKFRQSSKIKQDLNAKKPAKKAKK